MEEKPFNLNKLENRKAAIKLRTSSYKLGSVLGKWCNKISDVTLYKYCGNSKIENKINFFFECRNYDSLRKDTFKVTAMQIEKALINNSILFQKYLQNFAFHLFIVLQ